jgi:sec-independent protein translocase protein TatA
MGLENPIHLLVLAVIILLVFGSSQLPKIARSAGKHAREAKDGIASFKEEFDVGLGENNPLNEVTDTLRAANPKTIAREAVSKATTPAKKSPPAP